MDMDYVYSLLQLLFVGWLGNKLLHSFYESYREKRREDMEKIIEEKLNQL